MEYRDEELNQIYRGWLNVTQIAQLLEIKSLGAEEKEITEILFPGKYNTSYRNFPKYGNKYYSGIKYQRSLY